MAQKAWKPADDGFASHLAKLCNGMQPTNWDTYNCEDGREFWTKTLSVDAPQHAKFIRKTARLAAKLQDASDTELAAVKSMQVVKCSDTGTGVLSHNCTFNVDGWRGEVYPCDLHAVLKKLNAKPQQRAAAAAATESFPEGRKHKSDVTSSTASKRCRQEAPAAAAAAALPAAAAASTPKAAKKGPASDASAEAASLAGTSGAGASGVVASAARATAANALEGFTVGATAASAVAAPAAGASAAGPPAVGASAASVAGPTAVAAPAAGPPAAGTSAAATAGQVPTVGGSAQPPTTAGGVSARLQQTSQIGNEGSAADAAHDSRKGDPRKRAWTADDSSTGSDWTSSESGASAEATALQGATGTNDATAGTSSNSKVTELPQVDHAAVDYQPFRRRLYLEAAQISSLSAAEVDQMRTLSGIVVRGQDIPRPIKTWTQGGINVKVLEVLNKRGCEQPTPLQAQTLPCLLSGRDCFVLGEPGSGRTVAHALAMLRHVRDQPELQEGDGPVALVLAATLYTAQQIALEISALGAPLSMRCTLVVDGAHNTMSLLRKGTEVIAATPGRLTELLISKHTNLGRVTFLVIEEADMMLDMGLEPEVTRIINNIRSDRQSAIFSTTSSAALEALVHKVLTNPVDIKVITHADISAVANHHVGICTDEERINHLLQLLVAKQDAGKFLVWVSSADRCEYLCEQITSGSAEAEVFMPLARAHEDMSVHDIRASIHDFGLSGDVYNILVASWAIACDIPPIPGLRCVVNFDVPESAEEYLDSLRFFPPGAVGTALTFIDPIEEQYAPALIQALEDLNAVVPDCLRELAEGYYGLAAESPEHSQSGGCSDDLNGDQQEQEQGEQEQEEQEQEEEEQEDAPH